MFKTLIYVGFSLLLFFTIGCNTKSDDEKEADQQEQERSNNVGEGLIKLPVGAIPENEFPVAVYATYKGQLDSPITTIYSTDEGDYRYEMLVTGTDLVEQYDNAYLVFMSKSGRYGRFVKQDFMMESGAAIDTDIANEIYLRNLTDITVNFQVGTEFDDLWQYADFQVFWGTVSDHKQEGDRGLGGKAKTSAVDSIENETQLADCYIQRTEEGAFTLQGIPTGVAEVNGVSKFNGGYIRARLYGQEIEGVAPILREKWVEVLWSNGIQASEVSAEPLVLGLSSPESVSIDVGFSTEGNTDEITYTNYPLVTLGGDITFDLSALEGNQNEIFIRPNFNDNFEVTIDGHPSSSGTLVELTLNPTISERTIPVRVRNYKQSSINETDFTTGRDVVLQPENRDEINNTAADYELLTLDEIGDDFSGRLQSTTNIRIPFNVTDYELVITPRGTNATVLIDDEETNTKSLLIESGETLVKVEIAAENTAVKRIYTLVLEKEIGSSADLSTLYFDQFNLTPDFSPGITSYTASYTYLHLLDRDYISFDSVVQMTATAEESGSRFSVILDNVVAGQSGLDDTEV